MSRIRTGACREDRDAIRRNWPFADPPREAARQGEPKCSCGCIANYVAADGARRCYCCRAVLSTPFADKAPQGEPMPARVEQCPLAFGDLTSAHASTLHAIRREWEPYEPVSSCGHPGWYLAVFDGQAVRCEIGDCPAANACIDARRCLARRVDA